MPFGISAAVGSGTWKCLGRRVCVLRDKGDVLKWQVALQ